MTRRLKRRRGNMLVPHRPAAARAVKEEQYSCKRIAETIEVPSSPDDTAYAAIFHRDKELVDLRAEAAVASAVNFIDRELRQLASHRFRLRREAERIARRNGLFDPSGDAGVEAVDKGRLQ